VVRLTPRAAVSRLCASSSGSGRSDHRCEVPFPPDLRAARGAPSGRDGRWRRSIEAPGAECHGLLPAAVAAFEVSASRIAAQAREPCRRARDDLRWSTLLPEVSAWDHRTHRQPAAEVHGVHLAGAVPGEVAAQPCEGTADDDVLVASGEAGRAGAAVRLWGPGRPRAWRPACSRSGSASCRALRAPAAPPASRRRSRTVRRDR
jgi:hypothetical protein